MTNSRKRPLGGFVGRIVKEPGFQDVCSKSGKWFHGTGELFRRRVSDETFRVEMRAI
jgi:hypothetical protein